MTHQGIGYKGVIVYLSCVAAITAMREGGEIAGVIKLVTQEWKKERENQQSARKKQKEWRKERKEGRNK